MRFYHYAARSAACCAADLLALRASNEKNGANAAGA
jgi:hypothetical protein